MMQVRRNIHRTMQYFDVFERTQQIEHKSANEIHLIDSDVYIMCILNIYNPRASFLRHMHILLCELFIDKLQF